MIKLLYVIVIVVVVFLGLTFTYMNNQPVGLKYLHFEKQINLSLLLLITLVLGAIAGYLASLLSSLKVRRNLSKLKKELKSLESSSL